MEYKIILATVLIVTMSLGLVGIVSAKSSSSQVGFSDGVADCKLGYQYYINQHSNAGSHSMAYMNAYNQGYASCTPPQQTTNTNTAIANSNNDNTQQTLGQSSAQTTTCVIAIGSCGAPVTAQSANQQH